MPQQKIKFFGNLQPTGVDTSGSQVLQAMAGLTNQVGQLAFQEGARKRTKEGKLAGAQSVERGEDGKVIAPTLESDNTFFGESFNQAAILAHKAQVSMDVRQDLDRLENQHKLDPKAFQNAAVGARKGLLQGMPEELAVIIGQDFDASVSNRNARLLNESFKRESAQQRATALDSMETMQDDLLNAKRRGEETEQPLINANAELNAWVETGVISEDEARKIREETNERMLEQGALSEIDSIIFNEDLSLEDQFQKGSDFVESLRDRELKDLSPEQKDSLIRVVSAKVGDVGRNIATNNKQRSIEREKVISNLKIQANRALDKAKNGEASNLMEHVEHVELLHSKGEISGNERTSLMTKFAQAEDEFNRITLADRKILARQNGDNSIPMNKADIDSNYRRIQKPIIDQMSPEVQSLAKANYITQTRSIPSQVKQELNSQILSGDPDQIKLAVDLVDRIDNIPGLSNLAVDANQRAFMNNVVNLSQSMEPEQAIKIARELTDPRDKARVEAKEQAIKDGKMREDYEGVIESSFSGFFGGDFLQNNVNHSAVSKEYSELFESFYKAGDSKDVSEAKALEILHNNWKESDFGFMKHRPEDYYNVGGNTEYIKDQLFSDLKTGFMGGAKFKKDDIHLLSDDETARGAAQGMPTYRVIVVNENGEFQNFDGRWAPDPKIEIEKQQSENLKIVEEKREQGQKGAKAAKKSLEGLNL